MYYAYFTDLHLVVEKKNVPLDVDVDDIEEDQWGMIKTGDLVMPSGVGNLLTDSQETKSQYSQKTEYNTSKFSSQSSLSMISRVSSAYSNPQYPSFNAKINTAGLFTAVYVFGRINIIF